MMSAHKLLSGIINYQDDQTHLNDMLELSKSRSLTDSQYVDLFFAIGKAYEDLKQYEKSFEYIRKANEIKNTIITKINNATKLEIATGMYELNL